MRAPCVNSDQTFTALYLTLFVCVLQNNFCTATILCTVRFMAISDSNAGPVCVIATDSNILVTGKQRKT
jgi:hypothetical protein